MASPPLTLYAGWRQREMTNVIRRLDDLKARNPIDPMQMLNAVMQEAIETLAIVGELHDDETGEHVFRVGALSSLIAKRLGLSDEEAMQIDFAARLHDIGKIAVHADIMTKRAELTASERAEMSKHTTIGHEMLARIPHPVISMAAEIALNHHERWDGRGYPNGLARESIPLAARITSVADVFDALTHARCYKAAWTVEDSVSEIARNSEKAFDPSVVDAFLAVMIDLVGEHAKDGLDAALSVHAKENRYLAAKNFLPGVSSVRVAA
jgi:HD-GYP domain-containing protein (c-di-GMP phosphodiesterase class II)